MCVSRINTRERAIAHESGHVFVAAMNGIAVTARVYEAGWAGSTWARSGDFAPGVLNLYAVAGIVAECLMANPAITAPEIIEQWKAGTLLVSKSDLSGIPNDWTQRAAVVENVLTMIRANRELYETIADQLRRTEVITDENWRSRGRQTEGNRTERPRPSQKINTILSAR